MIFWLNFKQLILIFAFFINLYSRKPLENASPVMMQYTTSAASQPQPHRHRAHTINNATRTQLVLQAKEAHTSNNNGGCAPAGVNLCGYDSYLHATICSGKGHHGAAGAGAGVIMSTPNTVGVATPMRKKCNQKLIKSRLRHQHLLSQQQQQHHHHQSPVVAFQHREHQQKLIMQSAPHHQDSKQQQGRSKKASQQQLLLPRRSKSKEELVTREKLNIVEGLLQAESFIDKLKITEDFAERHALHQQQQQPAPELMILEYGSVPITAEPGECERLLAPTPSDEVLTITSNNNQNELFIHEEAKLKSPQKVSPTHSSPKTTTSTTNNNTPKSGVAAVHRYSSSSNNGGTHVHTHIHHHYHHFENEENVV